MTDLGTQHAKELAAKDGVSHINIDSGAKTGLGRQLDILAHTPFEHPVLGMFHSMEAFWCFVRSDYIRDDLRYGYGMRGKKLARSVKKTTWVKDFRLLIEEALYYKCVSRPTLFSAVKKSTLPFSCYYIREITTPGEERLIVIESKIAAWLTSSMENVRKMIQEGRKPTPADCTQLLNRPRATDITNPAESGGWDSDHRASA